MNLYTPDSFNTLIPRWLTAGPYTVHCRQFGHSWLHRWVIDMLSHCRQCGRHRQCECQHGI